jgi:hypothetical protein
VGENDDYNECHEDDDNDDTDGGSIVVLVDYCYYSTYPQQKDVIPSS